jgi:hypothetical protein
MTKGTIGKTKNLQRILLTHGVEKRKSLGTDGKKEICRCKQMKDLLPMNIEKVKRSKENSSRGARTSMTLLKFTQL